MSDLIAANVDIKCMDRSESIASSKSEESTADMTITTSSLESSVDQISYQGNRSPTNVIGHKQKKKQVGFANTCSVILIPSREEYFEAGIDLWFNRNDLLHSQTQVAAELRKVMEFNPAAGYETAMRFLYQPRLDYHNAFYHPNSVTKSPLSIFVVDKSIHDAQNTINILTYFLSGFERWNLTFRTFQNLRGAYNSATQPNGQICVDVLLIDENIEDLNHLKDIKVNDQMNNILTGICISSQRCESMRLQVIENGVEFLWPKPIIGSVDMLPILLIHRQNKNKLKISKPPFRSGSNFNNSS